MNSEMRASVLSFGEVLWDLIDKDKYIGGAPLNFAAHFVKCGGKASIFSAVGNDELGDLARKEIEKFNIDTAFLYSLDTFSTGIVKVFLEESQPDYLITENVAFDFIPDAEIDKLADTKFDIFYFGSLAQRNLVSRRTLKKILEANEFKYIFCDINIRKSFYSLETVYFSLTNCDILKINFDEVKIISKLLYGVELEVEEFAEKVIEDYHLKLIIITAAEKGNYVKEKDLFIHIPANSVVLVDAVGAGDAFSAAFMNSYLKDGDPVKASRNANLLGGYVASQRGAIPEYETEILSVLNQ